jgi:hypothetical protein
MFMSLAQACDMRNEGESSAVEVKAPGAIVMAGGNLGPRYRIVAISGESAWIRELDRGLDSIARLDRLRVV